MKSHDVTAMVDGVKYNPAFVLNAKVPGAGTYGRPLCGRSKRSDVLKCISPFG